MMPDGDEFDPEKIRHAAHLIRSEHRVQDMATGYIRMSRSAEGTGR